MIQIMIDEPCSSPELIPRFVGVEACSPSHRFGPFIRDCHLIHYCLSGHGRLLDKRGEHDVYPGNLFLIRPGEATTYMADELDPWYYAWIGFGGLRADCLSPLPSVLSAPRELFLRLKRYAEAGETSPDIYISLLYELFYYLFSDGREHDSIAAVKRYIDYHYMQDISVASIARHFGFERSYLFRLFRARYGMGVKPYLISVRMKRAREFLLDGYRITEAAAMAGYDDPLAFSRAYKQHFGVSPGKTCDA